MKSGTFLAFGVICLGLALTTGSLGCLSWTAIIGIIIGKAGWYILGLNQERKP